MPLSLEMLPRHGKEKTGMATLRLLRRIRAGHGSMMGPGASIAGILLA